MFSVAIAFSVRRPAILCRHCSRHGIVALRVGGLGRIVDRPWVETGAVVSRGNMTATLAADHRVSDGHRGGLYLAALGRMLQEPDKLV